MGRKLYVGNLPFSATEGSLSELFAQCGSVASARVISDRESGRSKGFGFIEMSTEEEAQKAIADFNGRDLEGRAMTVNEARPQERRDDSGSYRSESSSYSGLSGNKGRY